MHPQNHPKVNWVLIYWPVTHFPSRIPRRHRFSLNIFRSCQSWSEVSTSLLAITRWNRYLGMCCLCFYYSTITEDIENIHNTSSLRAHYSCTLTHWGRVTVAWTVPSHIWTKVGLLLIGPLETNLSEILIEIYKFSFMKMPLKISSAKWRRTCLGLSVLKREQISWFQISEPLPGISNTTDIKKGTIRQFNS